MSKLNIVWFRNDLRTYDNAVLCSAIEDAARSGAAVWALFIATPHSWSQHDMAVIKQDFIRRRVTELAVDLAQLNIPLLAVEGSDYQAVPGVMKLFAQQYDVKVFTQTEYELNEQQRDDAVEQVLRSGAGQLIRFDTQCIMPPGTIRTLQGDVYKVFTPFKRNWLSVLHSKGVQCYAKPKAVNQPSARLSASDMLKTFDLPAIADGNNSSASWPVEQAAALTTLRDFCQQKVQQYQLNRDYPAIDGTSKLSAYLAIGMISGAQCVARLQLEASDSWHHASSGAEVWLSELIWREFYKHILVAFPRLIMHQPFQQDTAAIRWSNSQTLFEAWCNGKTGYPIVDAAMRQLLQTGWMHNRLRMIVASFLVKDLHIDWRWGEQYFMQKLIDGDFAANNGGWQWAASTGTDAVPYFRIFNPITQSEKFDPKGDFIRLYVPELANVRDKTVHWPAAAIRATSYMQPIVDHALARKHTLSIFAEVKKTS